jgi:hypothetical protein
MKKITTHLKQNPHWISKVVIIAITLMTGLILGLMIPAIKALITQPIEHWHLVWQAMTTPLFWVSFVTLLASYLAVRHLINRWSMQMLQCQVHFSLSHQVELDQALKSQQAHHDPKIIHWLLKRDQHLIEVHGLIRFLLDVLLVFVTPLVLFTDTPQTQNIWFSIAIVLSTALLGIGTLFLVYKLRLQLDKETNIFLNSHFYR